MKEGMAGMSIETLRSLVIYKLPDNNLAKVSRVADDLHFPGDDRTAIQMSSLLSLTQY
jgi:hypothetical protein